MGPWRWSLFWCFHVALVRGTVLAGGQNSQERPPRPAGWSPAPSSSWAPTPEPGSSRDPEGSAAALAFLQTGDAQRLARANCSRGVAAGAAGPGPPPALRSALRAAPEALAHAANFLNMLFQTNDIREASVAEDVEWYQALVRSLAEGHPWVRRAVLALDAHPLAAKPRLMLQATKGNGEILLQDVSSTAPGLGNLSWDNEWFNSFKSQRNPLLHKRVLSNDLRSMETPKWQRGDSYVGEPGHVRWSPPFLECRDGRFLPAWAVTLSSAFYGLKPDLSPEFKGVVRVDIELRDVTIDQCASGPGWFADTHRCDLNSTQCVPQESRGFVLGRYLCRCKPGFYGAGGAASGARAGTVGADGGSRLACRPCRQGCTTCEDDMPCLIQEDRALRAAILSCQACCMLAVFLSMLVSYHFRRSKRIRASGVVLLEMILFGSLLLYFPVFILYFKPSIFRCIVLRWVRMLGFAIVYGTITLKLYRVLKVFLSRTAQRVPYVSSQRVLKMLGLILLLVLWFLAAWTIGMLENVDKNIPLVIRTQTARGLHFYICSHDRWDYMMVIAEMLFLLWGSFLCYATRTVPSAFHEPRYMGIALHNELMISGTFHVVRFIMVPSLHPDWTLLLFFAHTHSTITMTLALVFIPKFLHAGSPLREEIAAEVYEDELDMRHSGSCLNSSIASAWSKHSLDPDDIREELKKLYSQLEVHKRRKMAANNPHLPKKRSTRRSLGRSIVRRLAELPEAAARRSGGGERVGTPARRGSSAKRLPDAGGASLRMRDDGSRRRAAAPRKSCSTEGPAQEPWESLPIRGPPGEPTPGRKTMAETTLEQSDSESLDAAPLVCKSASTHNLAGHGQQPPSPRAAPLQKSLSVIAGAREEALLAASRAARQERYANRHLSALSSEHPTVPKEAEKPQIPGAADALLPASSSPAEGCLQKDTSTVGDGKVQKHVTYAPIKSISIDSSHLPGRVRVTVRRTPPPPPVRYQSLGQHAAPAGDSPEPAELPADSPAQAGEPERTPEGSAEEKLGHASPPVGKGRLLTSASIPAQVCPWELVQEEILSQKQKAAEAADSGTPGDTAATPSSLKPSSQKTSLRGLGLAIKAFNRSRGKSILRGKREGEGSLRKKGREWEGGSRRERPGLAEMSVVSLGGISQDPAAKSPEWSRQRPSSEPTAHLWQGDVVPCQHNNNAGTTWEAAGWGDGGTEGQWDSPAPGTGDGENLAEKPSALQGDGDASGGPEPPSGGHKVPRGVGHQEGAEYPQETPAVADSGKTQICPQPGAKVAMAEPGKDAPAAIVRLIAPKEQGARPAEGLESSRSLHPQDRTEVEQPHAKPIASSPHPSTTGVERAAAEKLRAEVCSREAPGIPAARGALLRQEAIVSREERGVPLGEERPAKVLEKGSSQPEPLSPGGSWGTERVPPRSRSTEVAPAAVGKASRATGRQAEVCPVETQADSSIRIEICPWEESGGEHWGPGRAPGKGSSEVDAGHPREELGMEKPLAKSPELLKVALEKSSSVEGKRAEVCPWETGDGGKTVRAEICPWDMEGAQLEKERQEGESIRPKSLGLLRAQESRSSLQVPSQPWGSTSSEEPPSKPAPKSSELCLEGTALSDAGKLDDGKISQMKKGISSQRVALRGTGETALAADKGSSQWGSSQPGEGAEQPGTGLTAKHLALPKTSVKQAGTIDSKKANICPWEVEDEPLAKTEICPWEEPAAPLGKERPSQDTHGTSKGKTKPGSGRLEDIKAKLAEMGGHGSEHRDTGIFAKLPRKSLENSKAESKKSQSVESIKEEVCPWESLGTEQLPEKTHARTPALPKSPSKKSQSVESLKAEVCPWEIESSDKAEICPWEAPAPPLSKEKSRQDKDALSIASQSHSTSHGLLKEIADSTFGKKEKASRDRESICPWESLGTEQLPEKPCAGSPALPKSPSKKSQSVESLKAEVCPWEAQELEATDKAEICPWEVAAPPSDQPKAKLGAGGGSKGDKRITRQAALASPVRSLEKGSSEREAVCPWESLGTEQPPEKPRTGSPALPKSPSKKSQSVESLKAEVCPWEAQEVEASDKAEICTWETAAPPSKEKSRHDKDALSIASQSPSTSHGLLKEIVDSTSGKEKASRDRESICPWESLDTEGSSTRYSTRSTELLKATAKKVMTMGSTKVKMCPWESLGMKQPPEKTRAGSPALPKSPSKKSQSVESLKAEVCPWEAQEVEATDKAEICPWEAVAPPSKEKSRQDKDALSTVSKSPSTSHGLLRESVDSTSGKKEKASRDRESICPWESLGTEQLPEKPRAGSPALPKSPSKKSQSVESLKAEVCPWEAQEVEATDKAEICPWEVAAPPSDQPKAKLGAGGGSKGDKRITRQAALASPVRSLEKGSSEREAVCPWESLGTEQPPEKPRAGSSALPKSPSKKSQSVESLKAEVCPWEIESSDKAEICPWEAPAPPLSKEKSRQDKDALSTVSKSPSTSHGLLRESVDSTSGKKEKASRDRESICPWESLGTEQLPEKPRAGSPALPKSPSKKSQSVESLKAEVCPWEAQELEATDKAEICPWEMAAPPSDPPKAKLGAGGGSKGDKRITRQAALASPVRSLEKGSSEREAVCPWESLGTEQPPEKPRTGSPALPKSPSKKSQSVESLKAEVCPWEAQEVESSDKAEICPWEVAAPLLEKGAAPGKANLPPKKAGASKPPEKGSSECEAICPWESLGTEELSLKTATGKEPSKKSDSTESRKSDICPWEAVEPTSSEKGSFKPGVHPRGADRASTIGMGKSKLVAGASTVSATVLLKKSKGRSDGEAEHKPLCRILPGIQPPRSPRAEPLPWGASTAPAAGSSPSPGTSVAEVCPWETEEALPASDKTNTDTRKTAEVCPWEVESIDPTLTLHRQGRAGVSPQDGDRGVSETKTDVCP
ncbi:probable G-protein coupled receptor 179 [Haliaeetus albicilla]|uniref:probable G-protein coupled receptor 179 n=1 Tax=Haliaeetus albicilla TaxID=8969 RepID=UPI0037E98AFF